MFPLCVRCLRVAAYVCAPQTFTMCEDFEYLERVLNIHYLAHHFNNRVLRMHMSCLHLAKHAHLTPETHS